ncbi:MAG: hypothetical protein WDO15_03615 [Bacteroidota bacterium]
MKKVLLFNPRAGDNVRIIPNAILSIAASIEGMTDYVIVDGNREKDPLQKILGYLSTGDFGFFASTVMPGSAASTSHSVHKKNTSTVSKHQNHLGRIFRFEPQSHRY